MYYSNVLRIFGQIDQQKKNYLIDIETGLYFGKKNLFIENQNIFISGSTQKDEQTIFWKIEKI